jgi:predicted transposase YbfD/YdcC
VIDEKSNEIPAVQKLLEELDVAGHHARRHALPKKTFEAAAEAQAHLIVQLKDNQPTLCRKVEAVCNDTKPLSCVQTVDSKKRNRHETRTVAVFNARPAVAGTEWQPPSSSLTTPRSGAK